MSRVSLLSRSFCQPVFHGTQRNFNPAYHEETRRPVEIWLRQIIRFNAQFLLEEPDASPWAVKTGHWFIGFRKFSCISRNSFPKQKEPDSHRGKSGSLDILFSLSLTKRRLNQIPHKPRFHTGLRAVRQSNGFIVGTKATIFSISPKPPHIS